MGRLNTTLTLQDLELILKLHLEGTSSVEIGRRFNRDHTTILYHIRRMEIRGLVPPQLIREYRRPTAKTVKDVRENGIKNAYKYQHLIEEKTVTKTYKQILAEAKRRDPQNYPQRNKAAYVNTFQNHSDGLSTVHLETPL